jgi:hypothetical protein
MDSLNLTAVLAQFLNICFVLLGRPDGCNRDSVPAPGELLDQVIRPDSYKVRDIRNDKQNVHGLCRGCDQQVSPNDLAGWVVQLAEVTSTY